MDNQLDRVDIGRSQRFLRLLGLARRSLFARNSPLDSDERSSSRTKPPGWQRPPIPTRRPPELINLTRVIPIVQRQEHQGLSISLVSLECYAEGIRLTGQYSPKYGARGPDNLFLALPVIVAQDDLGAAYDWWPKAESEYRFGAVLAPAPSAEARELALTVTEVRWMFPRVGRQVTDKGPWRFAVPLTKSR